MVIKNNLYSSSYAIPINIIAWNWPTFQTDDNFRLLKAKKTLIFHITALLLISLYDLTDLSG